MDVQDTQDSCEGSRCKEKWTGTNGQRRAVAAARRAPGIDGESRQEGGSSTWGKLGAREDSEGPALLENKQTIKPPFQGPKGR